MTPHNLGIVSPLVLFLFISIILFESSAFVTDTTLFQLLDIPIQSSIRRPTSSSCNIISWPLTSYYYKNPAILKTRIRLSVSVPSNQDDVLDVEIEQIVQKKGRNQENLKQARTNGDDRIDDGGQVPSLSERLFGESKSLLDLSFERADNPQWQTIRIPFCQGDEYIDCKLAFMVDFEGQSYGIAVPFDDAVALVMQENEAIAEEKKKFSQQPSKKTTNSNTEKDKEDVIRTSNINPESYETNEEYAELMQIFAAKVQEQFGEEYKLHKTPKVLTISGGLDKITEDWEKTIVSDPVPVQDLLDVVRDKSEDELNKDVNEFYDFMRQELGDEEFEKTMNEPVQLSKEDLDLMKIFELPGIGTQAEDLSGLEELIESMEADLEAEEVVEGKQFKPNLGNSALKLLGYTFTESGKSYDLVKPLQPVLLVGRHMKEEKECIRFQLLNPEEEKVIIPKLEAICQKELKTYGLSFRSEANADLP